MIKRNILKDEIKLSLFNEVYLQDFKDGYKVDVKELPNYTHKNLIEMDVEKEAEKLVIRGKIKLINIPDYNNIEKDTVERGYEEFLLCILKHKTEDINVFMINPYRYTKKITDAVITKEAITFEIPFTGQINLHVKRRREEIIEDIKKKVEFLNSEINESNADLKKHFITVLKAAKENAIKKRDNLSQM